MGKVAAAAVLAVLAALLAVQSRSIPFDYDEVAEFHAIWRVGQGHRPLVDFFYRHPPLPWLMWAPLLRRLPETFDSLVLLRSINLAFSVSALGFLLALLRKEKAGAVLAVATTALLTPVLPTLAQFRPDHLTLALTLLGLYLLDAGAPRRWAAAGALFVLGFLLTPKLVLLYAGAAAMFGWGEAARSKRSAGRGAAAFLGAAAAAALGLYLLARASGIDLYHHMEMAIQDHLRRGASAPYRFALGRHLLLEATYQPLLLGVLLACLLETGLKVREVSWRKDRIGALLTAFVLAQCLWVNFIWGQYLYTVMLLLSAPLAGFYSRIWRARSPLIRFGAAGLFLALAARTWPGTAGPSALERQRGVFDQLLSWAPPGYPVSMAPPLHVVFRNDSTFLINHIVIPRARTADDPMARSPEFGKFFSAEGIVDQLESRPPSVIFRDPVFSGREYSQAIAYYCDVLHKGDYEVRRAGEVSVLVRRRLSPALVNGRDRPVQ